MLSPLTIWALFFIIGVVHAALPACPNTANADYDFIVVGAGAGGGPLASRLAEAGYSVLLVDAGHDTVNYNTTLPAYFVRSLEDPQIYLNYIYQEYPNSFSITRNDQWYPRARALGGSTIHNAMINIIAGTRQDFDGLATAFDDQTWSRKNMQSYFRRIEDNLYIPPLLDLFKDHGFDGWLKTSGLPLDVLAANLSFLDLQIAALDVAQWDPLVAGFPIPDLNSKSADSASGVSSVSFTVDNQHLRSSVRDRLAAVHQSHPGQLHLSLDTLATKILLCNSASGSNVTAYGVEIAPGAALPVASNFNGKVTLNVQNVTARYEVIVSAGVFQSPQLLMLSGIGDKTQLSQFGIESIVHLPGVGTNLQDHDEVAVNWLLKGNYTLFNGCKWLSDPAEDPCLDYWRTHNHKNGYAFAGAMNAVITKSSSSLPAPDILTYYLPVIFRGFFRGVPQEVADIHNGLTAVVLKGHPSSKGTVKLTGSHPQDPLNIQKLHFQAPNGPADVAAIREGIKRARKLVALPPISLYVKEEIAPGPNVTTDDEIDKFIYNRVFGHHACCTNAIGPDNDPNAVLDGDFKVRGVNNLRVVDLSSWPNVPGFFVTTPTYMISEKAADVIISAARSA